jgi:hypothetical protein
MRVDIVAMGQPIRKESTMAAENALENNFARLYTISTLPHRLAINNAFFQHPIFKSGQFMEQGRYLYGVIETTQDHNFGNIGLKEETVATCGFDKLAIVYSNFDFQGKAYVPSTRANLLAHQRAIESVMTEFSILPFSFGTVTSGHEEIYSLLQNRYTDFQRNLNHIRNKVELGIKALWTNMDEVYQDISTNDPKVAKLKAQLARRRDQGALIEVGKLVENALQARKEALAQQMLDELADTAVEIKVGKNLTDSMFLNASFFVDKGREKEFDNLVFELGERYAGKVDFKYVGPLAPYNFIDLTIELEAWEQA